MNQPRSSPGLLVRSVNIVPKIQRNASAESSVRVLDAVPAGPGLRGTGVSSAEYLSGKKGGGVSLVSHEKNFPEHLGAGLCAL